MVMSLDDLKAENAAKEAEEAQKDENATEENETDLSPQDIDEENETVAAEGEAVEQDEGAELESKDTEKPEVEDWMKGDDHASQAEKKFTDADIGKAKAPLKSKLADKDSELEMLKAELEALKNKPAEAVQTSELTRPKRDDFYDNDDPEAAYDDAFADYVIAKTRATTAAETRAVSADEATKQAKAAISKGEDEHYERVAKLVDESGIEPGVYQSADLAFRQAIDNASPGEGDTVASIFMGRLGEGSDKVIFNVGINADKQQKLTKLLIDDPTGLDAGMYLAEIKATLTSPKKLTTNAPRPPPDMKGDATANASTKALKKRYLKSTDMQERINIRKQAREAGVSKDSINSW